MIEISTPVIIANHLIISRNASSQNTYVKYFFVLTHRRCLLVKTMDLGHGRQA